MVQYTLILAVIMITSPGELSIIKTTHVHDMWIVLVCVGYDSNSPLLPQHSYPAQPWFGHS